MLWSMLFGFMFHSTPPCEYEDGSNLKQHQVCAWDGDENSFIATRLANTHKRVESRPHHKDDSKPRFKNYTIVNMEYIYKDGHVEFLSWRK